MTGKELIEAREKLKLSSIQMAEALLIPEWLYLQMESGMYSIPHHIESSVYYWLEGLDE